MEELVTPHKTGDVETNPGLTTIHKQVWICDICYKQIYGMKQISIKRNRIEHWVHQNFNINPSSIILINVSGGFPFARHFVCLLI